MKNKRFIVLALHTALTLFVVLTMTSWIVPRPYTYPSGVFYNGVINYEAVAVLRNLSCISLVINAVISFAAWFYSKTFFIIHLVLAELCLAYVITSLLM